MAIDPKLKNIMDLQQALDALQILQRALEREPFNESFDGLRMEVRRCLPACREMLTKVSDEYMGGK